MRELMKNERLKLYRRRSTKVMLILMAVLIALACFAYVAIGAAEFLDDGY